MEYAKTLKREGRTVLELRVGQRKRKKETKNTAANVYLPSVIVTSGICDPQKSIDLNMCFGKLLFSCDFCSGFYGGCLTMHIFFSFSCDLKKEGLYLNLSIL